MTEYDNTIELGVLEEEALQSIETLLDKLGREPSPTEVKIFNSYNRREPKRDENYSRFSFPINEKLEGIAILGTMYIRKGSKRKENPHRILRNCFKFLSALGATAQGQTIAIHYHSSANNTDDIDALLQNLAHYSNQVGISTVDVDVIDNEQYHDYTLINVALVGTREQISAPAFNLAYSKLVLVCPIEGATDEAQDIVLSKLYAQIRKQQSPLIFLLSGRKGILGQLMKHLKLKQFGAKFFEEGFEGFSKDIDQLLIRNFKTELVFLTQHPGDIVKMASEFNVEARIIGEITEHSSLKIQSQGEMVCNLPLDLFTDTLDLPETSEQDPVLPSELDYFRLDTVSQPTDLCDVALELVQKSKLSQREHYLSFFDNTIGANNLTLHFPSTAPVFKLKEHSQALALRSNSLFSHLHLDSLQNSAAVLANTARELIASGCQSSYLFSSCSLKNASSRESLSQASRHMRSMQEAANNIATRHAHFDFNFDLRKNNDSTAARVTLTAGGLGILSDTDHHMTVPFKNKGDLIFLIGESQNCIGSSLYLRTIHGVPDNSPPYINWNEEKKVHQAIKGLIQESIICSARSIGKGGLFLALTDACMKNQLGFDITSVADVRDDAFLFGEANGRVLVSLTIHKRDRFIDYLEKQKVPFTILGHVTRGEMRIEEKSYGFISDLPQW